MSSDALCPNCRTGTVLHRDVDGIFYRCPHCGEDFDVDSVVLAPAFTAIENEKRVPVTVERDAATLELAQVIADSFFAMQAGETPTAGGYPSPEPNAGDIQLAQDIIGAGYSRGHSAS